MSDPISNPGLGTVRQVYLSGEYAATNPGWHEKDAAWKADQVRAFLASHGLRPASMCDVGCGSGGVLAHLRSTLPPDVTLVGFEPAPTAFEIARASHPDVEFRSSPAAPNEGEQFDVALVLDVIEHVEDCFGFLRSLHDLARFYVFHIPLDMTVSSVARLRPLVEGRANAGHLHYFCRETALATVEESGFTIMGHRFTPVALTAPTTRRRTRILRLPRTVGAQLAPNATARLLGGFSLLVLATRPAVDGP